MDPQVFHRPIVRVKHTKSDITWTVKVRNSHIGGGKGSKGLLRRRDFSQALIARFRAKYSKSDGCWLWQAGKSPNGYGVINIGRLLGGTQRNTYAHRLAYALAHGDIPAGSVVMHSCDVPACVNPAHLSLGTQAENVADGVRKGHYRRGALARWARDRKSRAA